MATLLGWGGLDSAMGAEGDAHAGTTSPLPRLIMLVDNAI
jgi:hypothetical protein